MTTDGWALVHAAQTGDTTALGHLFTQYAEKIHRFIHTRTGDQHLAEDITAETFTRALRNITTVTYQGRDIGAWLTTIARNLLFDHYKSSRHRFDRATADIPDQRDPIPGPEQRAIDAAAAAELLRCIALLTPLQQECIRLRFLEDRSVAETAEIMGRNDVAVRSLQLRAVRELAQLLRYWSPTNNGPPTGELAVVGAS